jgi:hypothetical protein
MHYSYENGSRVPFIGRKTQEAKAIGDELQAAKINGFTWSKADAGRVVAVGDKGELWWSDHRNILVLLGWIEYLDVWASSKMFFFHASFLGTTSLSLNHKVPSASSQKQATFGSPSFILLLTWPMPSSFFGAAYISSLKVGVRVMLNKDRSGNIRVLDSSLVKHSAGK